MKEKHTNHIANDAGLLPDALRMNPYIVPDGYFDGLNRNILLRCNVETDQHDTWATPVGYFEQLETNIHGKIAEDKLKEMVLDPGFSVPEQYFNQLAELSLAEASLRMHVSEPGYVVPADYFNDLPQAIAKRKTGSEPVTVRNINKRSWLAYAAAACMALFLTTWGVVSQWNDDQTTDASLASVSELEIVNYLELYGSSGDITFISEHLDHMDDRNFGDGLTEDDIEAYLNHTL